MCTPWEYQRREISKANPISNILQHSSFRLLEAHGLDFRFAQQSLPWNHPLKDIVVRPKTRCWKLGSKDYLWVEISGVQNGIEFAYSVTK